MFIQLAYHLRASFSFRLTAQICTYQCTSEIAIVTDPQSCFMFRSYAVNRKIQLAVFSNGQAMIGKSLIGNHVTRNTELALNGNWSIQFADRIRRKKIATWRTGKKQ